MAAAVATFARSRRRSELSLGLLVIAVTVGGYILVALANGPKLPPDVYVLLAWVFGLYLVAHLAIRRFAPAADGTLLPLAAMLNGIGFVMIARLAGAGGDYAEQARVQSVWVTIGIVVFVVTLIVVRNVHVFERYRYIALLLGIGFMLIPLVPVIGQSRNGARLWVGIGPLSFEPNEIAKVLLVAFFAAYLADKRELLTEGRIRIGRWFIPSPRDLGPLLLAWGAALLVLAYEQDIGTSLLFFGVFAAMLYMTTRRAAYLVLTVLLLVIGAFVAYKAFGRVRIRVENWTNPWPNASGDGGQPVQGWYALGSGGIAGTGLGLGQPWHVPLASTDYMFSSIGEELGLVGTVGVIATFMLFVGSAYRIAIDAVRPFTKLFAAGIATIIGLQTFLIIGGVTRVIPLTGISLPFVSYGGSSLVANFALLAILLRISDDSMRESRGRAMNVGIRRIGIAMIVLLVGLIAQLTYLQVARSSQLANASGNPRKTFANIRRDRGDIITSDGVIVAQSIPANDEFKHQRVYPADTATMFANVVGYMSLQNGSAGVESAYASDLEGRNFELQFKNVADALTNKQPVGTVVLTLSKEAQGASAFALAGRRGSVVVLDVQTGGILAAYSNPTFDPNVLATHDPKKARAAFKFLNNAPDNPLLSRAWRELYPPGSTFKTVTASIAQQNNVDVGKAFPVLDRITLPETNGVTLQNFGTPPEKCGGTMLEGFIVSCNTTFAQIGLDLGETFTTGIQNFGIQTAPPREDGSGIDPSIIPSTGPEPGTFVHNEPKFMQDAIGQNQVAVTPMAMGLVAEAIANQGAILQPHVVDCVLDPNDRVISQVGVQQYKRAIDPATADTMRTFMLAVVNDPKGTGTAAQIPGVQVAGKTGTAETVVGEKPHAWFIAFAPADHPKYAIAVLVEHGGSDSGEVTGGRVAAPIAKQVLQTLLNTPTPASKCPEHPASPSNGR